MNYSIWELQAVYRNYTQYSGIMGINQNLWAISKNQPGIKGSIQELWGVTGNYDQFLGIMDNIQELQLV